MKATKMPIVPRTLDNRSMMRRDHKYSPHKKTLNSDLSEEMNIGMINVRPISQDQEISPTVNNITPLSMEKEVKPVHTKIKIGSAVTHSLLTKKTIFSRSKQNNHKSIDDSKQKVHNQTKLKETPSIVVQTKANKTFHGLRSNSEINYEIDHKFLSKRREIRKAPMTSVNTHRNSSKANNPKQDFVSPYPLTKYNKGVRPSSIIAKEESKQQSATLKDNTGNQVTWGIPRSFRLSNNQTTETVRSMREQCMKNLFFHTNYDKRLDDFKSKLFLKHIFSLDNPNILDDEDSDNEMNIMDYIFKNLDVEELIDIEK